MVDVKSWIWRIIITSLSKVNVVNFVNCNRQLWRTTQNNDHEGKTQGKGKKCVEANFAYEDRMIYNQQIFILILKIFRIKHCLVLFVNLSCF